MSRPGTVITQRDAAPASGRATDTGTWFVVGLSDQGPTDPVLLTSPDVARRVIGERVSYSVAPDAIETYFAEGGSAVYFSRVVGPAAVKASATLDDASAADSIKVEAIGPGEFYNALNVAVEVSGSSFRLIVTHDDDGELERSPLLADNSAAVLWGSGARYVRVTDLGGDAPAAVAATPLAGGTDDRTNATDADYQTALDRFGKDLGPGQVSIPGRSGATPFAALLAHAAERNRRAVLDCASTDDTVAELETAAGVGRADVNAEVGAIFGPWAFVPGAVPGTVREVPYSAVQAGLIARVDAATGNPNEPAAGDNGVARSVVGLKLDGVSDDDRVALNEAGFNLARTVNGEVKTYGYRTLVDPLVKPLHWQFANVRLDMALAAQLDAVAERFVFKSIDGEGKRIAEFGGKCAAVCKRFYELGALFGATAEDAFVIDVGPSVNTVESIADGRLRVVAAIRRSPFAELVEVEVVKVAVNAAV